MNIIKIKKNKLVNILNIINSIINKKKFDINNPSIFFIEKEENKIEFIVNNNILELIIKLKTKNNKKLHIGISIKKLLNITKNFPECNLNLNLYKKKIIIKNNNIKFLINTINVKNIKFNKEKENYKKEFILSKKKLLKILNLINFIFKNEDEENLINGIFLKIKNNKIKITATDNYRIIFLKIKIKETNFKKKLIIPIKNINLLNTLLKIKKIKNINIKINKKKISFKIKNILINSKLIKLNFPVLKEKINKFYKNNFLLEKNLLKLALKRSISILDNKIKFTTWKIRKNSLKIITKNLNEKGEENIFIDYNGENIDININSLHILDIINNIKFKKLHMNFSDNKKIIIIKIPEYKKFKYIITSLKI